MPAVSAQIRSVSSGSSPIPFWRRMFKGRNTRPPLQLRLPTSISATTSSPEVHQKLPRPVTPTLTPSLSLVRATPSIHSSAENETQPGWSVTINESVKPSIALSFERAVTFGDSVGCVNFSSAGEYLAAGVNRTIGGWKVYIYDVKTGTQKLSVCYRLTSPSFV